MSNTPIQNTPEKFEGRAAVLRVSPWLAAEDLDGLGDIKVTIEAVHARSGVTLQDGRKEPGKLYSLKFKGKDRELILKTAENRRNLTGKFGVDTKAWIDKEITIYCKDGVRSPKGGTTKGIRIR